MDPMETKAREITCYHWVEIKGEMAPPNDPLFERQVAALTKALRDARRDALEEAIRAIGDEKPKHYDEFDDPCEGGVYSFAMDLATNVIRALATQASPDSGDQP